MCASVSTDSSNQSKSQEIQNMQSVKNIDIFRRDENGNIFICFPNKDLMVMNSPLFDDLDIKSFNNTRTYNVSKTCVHVWEESLVQMRSADEAQNKFSICTLCGTTKKN